MKRFRIGNHDPAAEARAPRWPRRLRATAWILAGTGVLINLLAWKQARAMTRFAEAGTRTASPDSLSRAERLMAMVGGITVPRPINRNTPADFGLPYETLTVASSGERRLEVWRIGLAGARGRAILFHGYASSKASLLPTAILLRDLGFETILVDFPGSGGSSGNQTSLGYREAEDVAAMVRAIRADTSGGASPSTPLLLFGGSMGAVAILRAVAAHGLRAEALILENPFDRMLNAVRNRFRAMGLPGSPGGELITFWGSIDLGINGFAHNSIDYAPANSIPTLMLEGALDQRATPEQTRAIFDRMPGAKEYVLIPDVGHTGLAKAAPDLWHQQASIFLDRYLPHP